MKRKQWFTQKTPPTTMGFDHLIFDGSERYLAWVSTEEDARLIAAAPELLEALDDLIHLAESAMLRANYDGGEYDIDGELSDARAAIAKALGEDV